MQRLKKWDANLIWVEKPNNFKSCCKGNSRLAEVTVATAKG